MMQDRVYLGLFIAFVAISLSVTSCKKITSVPVGVSFSKDTLNLGMIEAGNEKEFSIPIVNNSDTTIQIMRFSQSCKCLLLNAEQLNLPAHSIYTLRAKINPGKSDRGKMIKTIAIKTNEANPIKILSVVATII